MNTLPDTGLTTGLANEDELTRRSYYLATAPDMEALDMANEVLGGGFLSRLNADLREEKGWSYGVYSSVRSPAKVPAVNLTCGCRASHCSSHEEPALWKPMCRRTRVRVMRGSS